MIRVHCFGFAFTPRLISTVFLLLIGPLLISLGIWQLHRASDKRQLETQFERRHQAMLTLQDIANTTALRDIAYRSIQVTGHYDNAHQLLIDNKIMNHRVGYEVLTPFIPYKSNKIIMVNRGWIPSTGQRDRLPPIKSSRGKQTIKGLIKLTPKKAFLVGKNVNFKSWPALVQAIDKKQLFMLYHKPLYPFIILLSPQSPNGFVRKWRPIVITPEKHVAYAVQWFALALTLVIMYLVLNTKREDHDKPRKASNPQ